MTTPLILAGAAAMVALPARAVLRLRRRGRPDLAPRTRVLLALLAASITVGALLFLDGTADTLLAGHMLQHVLIGDLVPLLLVLAVRGPLHVHLLPVAIVRASRRSGLHRLLSRATRPTPALVLWAAALALWHLPALYDGALENEQLHAFEHLSFMVTGLLVWAVLLDPARRSLLRGWRRFGYALALLAASGTLANTLVLSYRPLYPAYAAAEPRPLGLTPVGDQNLAAVVMMLEQLATVGTFAVLTARRRLAEGTPPEEQPQRHPLAV